MLFRPALDGRLATTLRTIQFHGDFTVADRLVRFFHTVVGTTIA